MCSNSTEDWGHVCPSIFFLIRVYPSHGQSFQLKKCIVQHGFYLQFLYFPDTLECLTSSEDVIISYKKNKLSIVLNRMQLSMLWQLIKMYKNPKLNLKKCQILHFLKSMVQTWVASRRNFSTMLFHL